MMMICWAFLGCFACVLWAWGGKGLGGQQGARISIAVKDKDEDVRLKVHVRIWCRDAGVGIEVQQEIPVGCQRKNIANGRSWELGNKMHAARTPH